MEEEEEPKEGFFDRFAQYALDGFTAGVTFDIATIIRDQVTTRKKGPGTALWLVRGALRHEAAAALIEIIGIDPTNVAAVAAAQARVQAFVLVEAKLKQYLATGEQMWREMEEEDREALAEFMGLDVSDARNLSMGYDHG